MVTASSGRKVVKIMKILKLSRSLNRLRPSPDIFISQRPNSSIRHRNRGYALEEMGYLTERAFTRMFRLNRVQFYDLLSKIRVRIEPSDQGKLKATKRYGSFITGQTRLAVALRWLAGGSYLDISFAFGVSAENFFNDKGILWPTLEAIDSVLSISFPLNDEAQLDEIGKGFAKYSFGRMQGCVMAIDGIVIRTRAPTTREVENVLCFMNRKGFFGIVILAACDANCKFLMWSGVSPGSTHDCIAWEMTTLYKEVFAKKRLPKKYFNIGDDGFVNTNNFLTPLYGHSVTTYQDSYNYHLSAMRQCIERAFGILVRRWGFFGGN
jgi:hypothetical protein